MLLVVSWAKIAQSVQRLVTSWTVRDSNPGGERFSALVQTSSGAHISHYIMGTGSLPGVNRPGRGVNHPTPHLALRLRKEYNYTSTTPLGFCGLFYGDFYLVLAMSGSGNICFCVTYNL